MTRVEYIERAQRLRDLIDSGIDEPIDVEALEMAIEALMESAHAWEGAESIPISLVFDDLRRRGESVYNTEEGVELSGGDFHSGSTFPGTIRLDEEQAEDFAHIRAQGLQVIFWVPAPQGGDS